MAVDLKVSVSKEITSLRKTIAQKTSELASLRDELKRHQRVYELLGGQRARTRRTRARGKRAVTVDWNSVLKGLPATFTLDHIYRASAVKGKPRGYLRHVVVKWARQHKIKRTGWGRYRKVQGR
ncbi:MAG: hypothetical protein V3W08_12555 [Candidatus Binatia bacterium]